MHYLASAYLGFVARDLTYGAVCAEQAAPHATVGHGAAGLAFALWQHGARRDEPAWLDRAEDFLRAAVGDRRRSALTGERPVPGHSVMFGRAGLVLTDALLAASRGDARRLGKTLARYRALARAAVAAGDLELYGGAAGLLAGAALIARTDRTVDLSGLGRTLLAALEAASR